MTEKLIIRNYSKAIFLLPTLVMSIVGWIIQAIIHEPFLIFELIWLIIFVSNLFVVCFDFSSSKFIILIFIVLIFGSFAYFVLFPLIFKPTFFSGDFSLELGFTSHFYILLTGVIFFFMLITIGNSIFNYYSIERNELYHRKGIFNTTERWTLTNLRFKKEIPDIFEFMMFRAGTLSFYPTKTDVIILPTVLNINRKERQLDRILSKIQVDISD
ncbi:hypothetical protein LCGC14_1413170 [marine sediment metagenome]|uniref:Uncharacterized protein n=1 Tax=marine sediment metagenome TaxID=412755 RepID=A0A0F9JTL5_9ZZZZ